jgi:sulfur transfer protein SufE
VAVSDKPAADHLKQMAINDMQSKPNQALQLFQTAEKQYQYVVDNSTDQAERDAAQNEIVDCQALIWLMQHQS